MKNPWARVGAALAAAGLAGWAGHEFWNLTLAQAGIIGGVVAPLILAFVAIANASREGKSAEFAREHALQGLTAGMVTDMRAQIEALNQRVESLNTALDAERVARRAAEDKLDLAQDEIHVLRAAITQAGIALPVPATPPATP